MFRIKKRNVDAFLAREEQEFETRVVRRLRDNFDALREKSDDALRAFVQLGVQRAAGYGIDSAFGISLYVGLMAELGEDFDGSGKYLWAEEILQNDNILGSAKVRLIFDQALEAKRTSKAAGEG